MSRRCDHWEWRNKFNLAVSRREIFFDGGFLLLGQLQQSALKQCLLAKAAAK
jgi:hypothetical protein